MTSRETLNSEKETLKNHEKSLSAQEKTFTKNIDELKTEFTTTQNQLQQQLITELRALLDTITNVNKLMTTLKDKQLKNGQHQAREALLQLMESLESKANAMLDRLTQEKESIINNITEESSLLLDELKKSLDESVKTPLEHSLSDSQNQVSKSLSQLTDDIEAFFIQEQEVIKHNITATFDTIESELKHLESSTKDLATMSTDVETSLKRLYHQVEGHLEGTEHQLNDEIQILESLGKKEHEQTTIKVENSLNTVLATVTQKLEDLTKKVDESTKQFQDTSNELQQSQNERIELQVEQIKTTINEHLSNTTINVEKLVADIRRQFRARVYDELEQMVNSFVAFQDVVMSQIDEVMTRLKNAQVEIKSHLEKMLQQKLQAINQIGEQFEITIEKSLQQLLTTHVKESSKIASQVSRDFESSMKSIQEENLTSITALRRQLQQHVNVTKQVHTETLALLQQSSNEMKKLTDAHGKEFLNTISQHLSTFKERHDTVKKTSLNEIKETINMHAQEILTVLHSIEERAESITTSKTKTIYEQKQKFEQQITKEMSDIGTRLKTMEQEAINSLTHAVDVSLSSLDRLITNSIEKGQQRLQEQRKLASESIEMSLNAQQQMVSDWMTEVQQSLNLVQSNLQALFTEIEGNLEMNLKKSHEHLETIKKLQASLIDLQKSIKTKTSSELESMKRRVNSTVQEVIKSIKETIRTMETVIQVARRPESTS